MDLEHAVEIPHLFQYLVINEIAKKHGKSPPQVSEEKMMRIDGLDRNLRYNALGQSVESILVVEMC
jgi:hypothetical protein